MMKKLLTVALILAMVFSLSMVVSGRAAGPFSAGDDFIDYYDEEGRDAWTVLQEALEGRTFIENPEFVDGSEGFGDEVYGEWPDNMFDMSWWKYNEDGGRRSSKLCTNWERFPVIAVWRYEQAYVVESFLIATANDCEGNPRRMGDGWTFSGANSADGPWTVLWEGLGSDYEPINRTWWRFDLENEEAFQYFRLYADEYYDEQDLIQLSNIALAGALPSEDAEDEDEADENGYDDEDEEIVIAPITETAAPQTFDPISIIAIGALASATGIVLVKKRKN